MDLESLTTQHLAIPLAVLAFAVLYIRSLLDWRSRTRGAPLPPGPRPLPIIGNLLDLPKAKPTTGFRDICAKYGDVTYLRVLCKHIVVFGDATAARAFLEKHSATSSDRPPNPVFEFSGQTDCNFAHIPYGQSWRDHRRLFWQHFYPGAISKYEMVQRAEAHRFLARLLESPSQLTEIIRITFSALMLRIVYDIDITEGQWKDFGHTLDEALEALAEATPGRFAVEILPFLGYLPAWFPGAGFQKTFARCRAANERLKHAPFDDAKMSLQREERRTCVAAELLTDNKPLEGDDELLRRVCATAFIGGAETSASVLQGFFVAMALYPEAQKRAQAELDAVVGPSRLPEHEDCKTLVYVNALIKECLRWHSGIPFGIPHSTTRDDQYEGYFIPAGTTVVSNVWEMLHDPEAYDEPFAFRPERFIRDGELDPAVRDPTLYMFGFGRRVCPGRYFAHSSLFITIASLLHVFDFGLPLDENGRPIQITYEPTPTFVAYPQDCRCSIKPRSAEALALIVEAQGNFAAPSGEMLNRSGERDL